MFRLEEEKNSRGTVMSGSAIRGRQGSERFFTLPVVTLIASSFVLGMSEFVVVGILPDIAHGLRVSEVTVGDLVSMFAFVYAPMTPLGSALSARFPRFATHLTLIGVFLAGNILCALAPNYAVLVVARIMIAAVSGTWVANMFGWRWAFHPVIAMTVVVIVLIIAVLPHYSHMAKVGFLPLQADRLTPTLPPSLFTPSNVTQ